MLRPEVTGAAMEMKVQKARTVSIGKLRGTYWNLAFTIPGDTMGVVKKLIGATGLDVYAAVVGADKLVFTMGPAAKARFLAIASGKSEPPKGAVAEAISLQANRTLYYYGDLRQLLSLAGALGGKDADPRLRIVSGLLSAPIPIAGGVAGNADGRVLTVDLTFPPSCIAGIGSLVGALMGVAGPPPAAPAKPL
jgi:hypothetical protein